MISGELKSVKAENSSKVFCQKVVEVLDVEEEALNQFFVVQIVPFFGNCESSDKRYELWSPYRKGLGLFPVT